MSVNVPRIKLYMYVYMYVCVCVLRGLCVYINAFSSLVACSVMLIIYCAVTINCLPSFKLRRRWFITRLLLLFFFFFHSNVSRGRVTCNLLEFVEILY